MTALHQKSTISTNTTGAVSYPASMEDRYDEIPFNTNVSRKKQPASFLVLNWPNSQLSYSTLVYTGWLPSTGETKFDWNSPTKTHPLANFLGTWKGNDIEQLVEMVYKTRSKI